ncbi:MAG TPA: BON domain-containing protein [Galbitalea sp.]|jgi:osmotically-inducible protein OsmY
MDIKPDARSSEPATAEQVEIPATEMHSRVEAALIRQAEIDADAITFRRDGRRVILGGLVSSHAARHCAAMALWGLPGVSEISNELKVNRSWPEPSFEGHVRN